MLLADCILHLLDTVVQPVRDMQPSVGQRLGRYRAGAYETEYDKDNIVFKTILYDFERLVRPKAVINKNPWFLIRLWFSFGIKHVFDPVKADLGVGVPRLGARKMPSRGRVCSQRPVIFSIQHNVSDNYNAMSWHVGPLYVLPPG
jgi:hypothetical protein